LPKKEAPRLTRREAWGFFLFQLIDNATICQPTQNQQLTNTKFPILGVKEEEEEKENP
jgi:hypothetical protein